MRKSTNRGESEHGVIMVASVLKSDIAAQVSIRIAKAFVSMRKALASIAPMMVRLEVAERRQIDDQQRNEERFDTIFKAMDGGDFPPQKVFFEGNISSQYYERTLLSQNDVKKWLFDIME